jgi:hypothetical protein
MAHDQECFGYEQMDTYNKEHNQVPLFSTDIYRFENGDMIAGEAIFMLNVSEGHWTLYSKYNKGEVCIEAYGDNFKDQYKGN